MESPKEKPKHDSNVEWTDKDEEMVDDKDDDDEEEVPPRGGAT
jgi:hypothetical protein